MTAHELLERLSSHKKYGKLFRQYYADTDMQFPHPDDAGLGAILRDCKAAQLVLMYDDEKKIELLSVGFAPATADGMIKTLNSKLKKWNRDTGMSETALWYNTWLHGNVEDPLILRDPNEIDEYLFRYGKLTVRESLRVLAFAASWAPLGYETPEHRKLRSDLLAKVERIAKKMTAALKNKKLKPSVQKEYFELKWLCLDLACSRPKDRYPR